jgi:hypothetical protein
MAKKKKVKETVKKVVKKVEKTIRMVAEEAIMKAYDFQGTLYFVKKAFPDTKFSKRCYYWYRSHLKTDAAELGKVVNVPKAIKTVKAGKTTYVS